MDAIKNFFTSFIQKVAEFLFKVLPKSPFRQYLRGYENGHSGLLRAVNYFIPIPTFISITSLWVTAMFLYYLYHGLVKRVWDARDKTDRKEMASFFGRIFKVFAKWFK